MELGVLIVTYNSGGYLGACLEGCRRYGLFDDSDVLVVDNASGDESVKIAQEGGARVLANPTNRGFAAAVNQGVKDLDTTFVLLLNPDATLQTSVHSLVADCCNTQAAAAGGKLVGLDGVAQRGFQVRRFPTAMSLTFEVLGINRIWPQNPISRRYRCWELDPEAAADVEQPAGAFLLFRKEAWKDAGGFDERFYPLWFEDVDFLKRVAASGKRIRYVPDSIAQHAGGHSIIGLTDYYRQLYWYGSLLRYVAHHFSPIRRVQVSVAVAVGIVLRSVMGTIRYRSFRPIAAGGKVLHLAAACVFDGKAFEKQRVVAGSPPPDDSLQIDEERIRRSA